MEVSYATPDNKKMIHSYTVKIGISTVDRSENPSGIAVTQVIALPDTTKSQ
jgi:hypothetical protein